ncbi:MAG: tetraacyldisaccharide 4'-kinase [Bacteroidales bacterium]|jgi:tetraacyldisaccharide 4'-kinase|nr:tetraacyldisaccharide 4'-kinase [Bacteroidales bacterium]MDG1901098.1 tetraacyldisaccharide 4'-kinase [Bacteroidales bacterium]MDG2082061.1 tetraacyldisaccharide 4'-kinase [Bacteroidales bacterium]|tara:strand:- start:2732 stop:3808 length:1077 start_codon:yes stop_codon:yes gene_type:complete
MGIWKLLLLPIAALYGLIIRIRHWMFNTNILESVSYDIPLIGVGNLNLGGTGKTPMVEFIIRLLLKENKVAVLSRGYGRTSKGYLIADQYSDHQIIGDEPMQYHNKFRKELKVAVCENRRLGIDNLMQDFEKLDAIVLDDSFQHRYVKPGLSILLTDFHNLYMEDYLLPAGSLRDVVSAAKRADIIIVTKTFKVLSPITRRRIKTILKPDSHQSLYFSYLDYGDMTPLPGIDNVIMPSKISTIVLFCGIANPYPLQEYLRDLCIDLHVLDFPDHHVYKRKDIEMVIKAYEDAFTRNKIIITTEKDAMRLIKSEYIRAMDSLPLFYIPIEVKLHGLDQSNFSNQIKKYVRENKRNSGFH